MEDRGSPTANQMDHVHASLFDKGGWLRPGEIGTNLTNRPEAVLRESPDDLVRRTIRKELTPSRIGGMTLVYNEKPIGPTELAAAMRRYDFMVAP